jgi:hypothetical protein
MILFVGVVFEIVHLIIPAIVLVTLILVTYRVSKRMFVENKLRWSVLRKSDWMQTDTFPEEQDDAVQTIDLTHFLTKLKDRRRVVFAIITIVIVFTSIFTYGYDQVHQYDSRIIIYESPTGGQSITIGELLFDSFIGVEHPETSPYYLSFECRILDSSVNHYDYSCNYGVRQMTLVEFLALNETEIEEEFRIHGGGGGSGNTFTLSAGTEVYLESEYIWILRFFEINEQTSGSINLWIQIYLT